MKESNRNDLASQFTRTQDQTIKSISTAEVDAPIILDFDETLFLRNSTQEYLNSIYPRPLGAALLVGVKAIQPWRWFPSRLKDKDNSRDWLLVLLATVLFPWTWFVWKARAKQLAERYCNYTLAEAVSMQHQNPIVVSTLGFDFVIKPLLKHWPVNLAGQSELQLIACRFWQGALDRANGKLAMVTETLGTAAVKKAVLVTDAIKDAPLLSEVTSPCLIEWPGAESAQALRGVYVPLFYSEKVKNPGKSHILKRVLMGHWSFLVVALTPLSTRSIINALSLLLLVLSYWCIYEIGYQENDFIGEKYESNPRLTKEYLRYKESINLMHSPAPWLAASFLGMLGLVLIHVSNSPLPIKETLVTLLPLWPALALGGMMWLAFLGSVRLAFALYNRFDEKARIWIYLLLSIQKMFGFTLIAGTSMVGTLFLLSHIFSRWLHYIIYRCGGDRKEFPMELGGLCWFLSMLFATIASSPNPVSFLTWQTAIALGYYLTRGIKDVYKHKIRFKLLTPA